MMMLAGFINSDAFVKDLSAVADDPVPLIDSGAAKDPLPLDVDSPSEPPPKRMRGSSSRRIKCKARGLSNNHNSDNAYFKIAANAPHGLLVSCSHPECAGSGRRGFRYCQGKKFVNGVLLFCNVHDKASHRRFFFTLNSLWRTSREEKLPQATWARLDPICQAAEKGSRCGLWRCHRYSSSRAELSTLRKFRDRDSTINNRRRYWATHDRRLREALPSSYS